MVAGAGLVWRLVPMTRGCGETRPYGWAMGDRGFDRRWLPGRVGMDGLPSVGAMVAGAGLVWRLVPMTRGCGETRPYGWAIAVFVWLGDDCRGGGVVDDGRLRETRPYVLLCRLAGIPSVFPQIFLR